MCGKDACVAKGTALAHTSVSGLLSSSGAGCGGGVFGAASGRDACTENIQGLKMQLCDEVCNFGQIILQGETRVSCVLH